jgi:F-type H+-transporting ATPase subunit b
MLLAVLLATEEGAQAPAGPFSVNFGLIFWTWVVFIALLVVLSKFAWPAILKATEEREEKVRQQLGEAERMNLEARTLLEEQKKLTAEARSSAQTLLANAKAAVERERSQALEKIKQDQEALMDRARRDIAAERDKAIADLRREAVDLALGAASKVVGERLDGDRDRQIVLDYVAGVERSR